MIVWFIVGFSVVLCVFFLLAAFREGHRIREIDMNKRYHPDTWSIFKTLKVRYKRS